MNNRIINYLAFAILTLLWLGFGAALLMNQVMLQVVWQTFRSWPLVGQLLVTLFTLPVILGLWIWQTPWPFWLRLILVIGLAWVTVFTFLPKKATGKAEVSPARS